MDEPLLLQIYIPEVTPQDWQKLYRFLNKTEAHLSLSINDKTIPFSDARHILDEGGHPLQLDISLANIKLQAFITNSNTIKLCFSPETLESEAQRKVIMRLMGTLSRRLRKEVMVTPVDKEDIILFSYSLETGWVINTSVEELRKPLSRLKWYLDDIKHQITDMFE
jgi:hypothetical protein